MLQLCYSPHSAAYDWQRLTVVYSISSHRLQAAAVVATTQNATTYWKYVNYAFTNQAQIFNTVRAGVTKVGSKITNSVQAFYNKTEADLINLLQGWVYVPSPPHLLKELSLRPVPAHRALPLIRPCIAVRHTTHRGCCAQRTTHDDDTDRYRPICLDTCP